MFTQALQSFLIWPKALRLVGIWGLLCLGMGSAWAGPPPWTVPTFNQGMYIYMQPGTLARHGNFPMNSDYYIGYFYLDNNGTYQCAGYAPYNPFGLTEIWVCGSSNTVNPGQAGFIDGQFLTPVVWNGITNCALERVTCYYSGAYSGLFQQGQVAYMDSVIAENNLAFRYDYRNNDDTVCAQIGNSIFLNRQASAYFPVTYSSIPAGLFLDTQTGAIIPNRSLPGTYTVIANSPTCISQNFCNVVIQPPKPSGIPPIIRICPGDTFVLRKPAHVTTLNLFGGQSGPFQRVDSTYRIARAQIIPYIYIDNRGCSKRDTLNVLLNNSVQNLSVSLQNVTCDSVRVVIQGSNIAQVSFETERVMATSLAAPFYQTYYKGGRYSVTAISPDGCSTTTYVDVPLNPIDVSVAQYSVCQGQPCNAANLSLTVDPTTLSGGKAPLSFALIPENNTLATSSASGQFRQIVPGLYTLKVIDAQGCEKTIANSIDLRLPSTPRASDPSARAFTPNGDGQDDTFFLDGTGEARIFNRQGRFVKRLPLPAYWDGTDQDGKPLEMGLYILEYQGKNERVTLIR